jgi:hypothetical protein
MILNYSRDFCYFVVRSERLIGSNKESYRRKEILSFGISPDMSTA